MNDALPLNVLPAQSLPMVKPDFNPSEPGTNYIALCELFATWQANLVPVESVTIRANDDSQTFTITEQDKSTSLLLLYLMDLAEHPTFTMNEKFRREAWRYFGDQTMSVVSERPKKHPLIASLFQGSPVVSLVLRPGYQNFLAKGRSVREILARGWENRDRLSEGSNLPLLRKALKQFFSGLLHGTLAVGPDNHEHWPTQTWVDRAREMATRLGMKT